MSEIIAAIATGMTQAGIGIIRISGEGSIGIADQVFVSPSGKKLRDVKTHTIHYGHIVWQEEVFDEVLVSVMHGPHTFTGEETVEINCHGGLYILKKILDLLCSIGARLAEPGEFSKRAFLNGKKDLSESEAIMDVIGAGSDAALRNSMKMLQGGLYEGIKNLREEILFEIAFIESALDDPEHISLDGYQEKLSEKVARLQSKIKMLIDSYKRGSLQREGIGTVLLGRPNAGKSSILNVLARKDRAIVTDIPGTTRDTLEETILLGNLSLRLYDTAGLRETEDTVEKIGVDKALETAKEADLILYVIDGGEALTTDFEEMLPTLSEKNCIVLVNKFDLESKVTAEEIREKLPTAKVLSVCASKEKWEALNASLQEFSWVKELEDLITDLFFKEGASMNDEILITNLRHKRELEEAKQALSQVQNSIEMDMPEDFLSIDLMAAYSHLGFIIGEEVDDDLVDEIFSKFCMGK
ncbi:MAG: tRNA uridine-5-carboxymethylaminomethyl(34) synthesis GTPase MnmE [Lachnospiraceae bacterium]|nr:tRNA uridine-5-carboxymethylaminomethyl(34) synthesis GTPase MnmE [Lachnospiraceae bacterium]